MPLQEKLSGNVHQGSGNSPCAIFPSVVKARQQFWAEVLTTGVLEMEACCLMPGLE